MHTFDIVPLLDEDDENHTVFSWSILVCGNSSDSEKTWVGDFMEELTPREAKRWKMIFRQAAEGGPGSLPADYRHPMDKENGIYELIYGNYRVPYFSDGNRVIICTHYFRKKSQKTKQGDKDRAVRCKDAYLEAKKSQCLHHVIGE